MSSGQIAFVHDTLGAFGFCRFGAFLALFAIRRWFSFSRFLLIVRFSSRWRQRRWFSFLLFRLVVTIALRLFQNFRRWRRRNFLREMKKIKIFDTLANLIIRRVRLKLTGRAASETDKISGLISCAVQQLHSTDSSSSQSLIFASALSLGLILVTCFSSFASWLSFAFSAIIELMTFLLCSGVCFTGLTFDLTILLWDLAGSDE